MTLRDLRTSKGLRTSFVAKKLGVSTRHFTRIENNEGYLTKDRAKILAKLYELKMSEILKCVGEAE